MRSSSTTCACYLLWWRACNPYQRTLCFRATAHSVWSDLRSRTRLVLEKERSRVIVRVRDVLAWYQPHALRIHQLGGATDAIKFQAQCETAE